MRAIQDEMQEMRSKLSTVVETLSNVVDTLVKSSKDEDEKSDDESAQPQNLTHEKAVQFNERKIRPRNSDRAGFCCFKSHSVKSRDSDSDYYRPRQNLTPDSKSHNRRSEPDVTEDRIPPEIKSSSESSGSIGCQNLTACHFLQRLLYRARLLFF
ncbi:uncharacterized protein LOC125501479 [Athalia rosae]|uniref:uncharacterized protein LOC125501479 n=1 Tax=Athalia rosae TaxID=37344 RepID=UPI002034891D|nr:uncharacterized protein LOC125501479 [Athalia rosae]